MRFSLRLAMTLLTAIAIAVAAAASLCRSYIRSRQASAQIRNVLMRRGVEFAESGDPRRYSIRESESVYNLPPRGFDLFIEQSRLGNNDLAMATQLPGLKGLSLKGSGVSDDGLLALSTVRDLDVLIAADTVISDDGLATVARLESLQYLDVSDSRVSNKGIDSLVNMPNLRVLSANRCDIHDLNLIGGFISLEVINVRDCPLRQIAFRRLPRLLIVNVQGPNELDQVLLCDLPNLDLVEVVGAGPGLAEVAMMGDFGHLTTLILDRVKFNGSQLGDVGRCENATFSRCIVGDDIVLLLRSGSIRRLRLQNLLTRPPLAVIKAAIGDPRLRELSFAGTYIDDGDLMGATIGDNLERINLSSTQVTHVGIQWLVESSRIREIVAAGLSIPPEFTAVLERRGTHIITNSSD